MLIDLGPGIFKQATVDTNILLIEKSGNDKQLKAVALKKTNGAAPDVAGYFKDNAVDLNNLSEESWFIGNDAEQKLKEKIEKIGKPLKDWDVNIYYGIKTGLNEAFIIDTATKEKLCKEDPKSAEIIKPILRGRDIQRFSYEWAGLWILATGYDINVPKKYPAVYKYMLQYEEQAKKRDDQGANWWNLRACAYYNEFEKEKIVWARLMRVHKSEDNSFPRFGLAPVNSYVVDSLCFIVGKNIKYFAAVLNSKYGEKYFRENIAILDNGGMQMRQQYVELIKIPQMTSENKSIVSEIESLVSTILSKKEKKQSTLAEENQIDKLVYKLYELTDEEIMIVEGDK